MCIRQVPRQRFKDGTAGKVDLFLKDETAVGETIVDFNIEHLSPDELEAMIMNLEKEDVDDDKDHANGTLEDDAYETQGAQPRQLQQIPEDGVVEWQKSVDSQHAK